MAVKTGMWLAGAALMITLPGAAGAQQAAQPTVQQQFEAGSAALAGEKWQDALSIFEALGKRLASGKSDRSKAIVQVRKAEALVALGRDEEARAAIASGLPRLPTDDTSLIEDRLLAHMSLGKIFERGLDYAGAHEQYRAAKALASAPFTKARVLGGLVRTGMFLDANAALADVDEALALVTPLAEKDKTITASFRTLKGRALLNLGRFKEGRAELNKATRELGGLTMRVDVNDLAARSDLMLAALLDGDEDEARRYMAYTGAGRTKEAFGRGYDMAAPSCDEEGLSPGDVAVIQFGVADDGAVVNAVPIYASRQGTSALAFARAASRWSWSPEQAVKIPPLFRLLTRVEMRCSTAAKRPSVLETLEPDMAAWLESRGEARVAAEEGQATRQAGTLEAALAAKPAGSLAAFPILVALAANAAVSAEDTAAYLDSALAIARAEKAPAPVIAQLLVRKAQAENAWNATRRRWKPADLSPLMADPVIAADPRASAAIRLMEADRLTADKKIDTAKTLLNQTRDTPGLGEKDPLRVGALVRLASLELLEGNKDAARAAFEATGLTAQQCALVDAVPNMTGGMPSSNAFPQEALRWGFEGWAVTEFDVAADGKTQNMRTTIAYPPFTFGKATEKAIGNMRYRQTYRPEGGLGCGGLSQSIQFRLPD
jgi:tetratricopeptide (TPR) repeat protein